MCCKMFPKKWSLKLFRIWSQYDPIIPKRSQKGLKKVSKKSPKDPKNALQRSKNFYQNVLRIVSANGLLLSLQIINMNKSWVVIWQFNL